MHILIILLNEASPPNAIFQVSTLSKCAKYEARKMGSSRLVHDNVANILSLFSYFYSSNFEQYIRRNYFENALLSGLGGSKPSGNYAVASQRVSLLDFVRRLWNQILTWLSVSPNFWATCIRRQPVR